MELVHLFVIVTLTVLVSSQTCPDNFPAVFKCVPSKSHKGEYVCKGDPSLGCEFINGIPYCCEREKDDEDRNSTKVISAINSTTDSTVSNVARRSTTQRYRPNSSEHRKRSSYEESEERGRKTDRSNCQDRGPDCTRLSHLCNNPIYEPLMRVECQVSCGHCERPIRHVHSFEDEDNDVRNGREIDDCEDKGPDCVRYAFLCSHPAYSTFMRNTECKKTCGLC
ncbi:ShKT domain-containing protein [Aphelenchoides besseyi]|nr:ShKT domain-containing protein [Aphelenchoides besseyi]